MLRAALVTNFAPHYRQPLFDRLSTAEVAVDLIFTSRGTEWYADGTPRAEAGTSPAGLVRRLREGHYDCVVTSLVGRSTLLATVAFAATTRTPLVTWTGLWHHPTTMTHRLSRPLVRALYRRSNALLVYGEHVRRFVANEASRHENVFTLPQAVDNARFRRPADPLAVKSVRRDLALDGSVGAFVGRFEPDKGLDVLVRALKRSRHPDVFLFVGSGSLEGELRRSVIAEGLEHRARFVGRLDQDRLPAIFALSSVLVLPSVTTSRVRECWGLVVNEAMNAGTCVIVSDAVGAAAGGLVESELTGFVVPEGDADALSTTIDRAFDEGALRSSIVAAASERVLQWNFDAGAEAFRAAVVAAVA